MSKMQKHSVGRSNRLNRYKGEMLNDHHTWVSDDGLVASVNKEETPMGTAGVLDY